MQKNRTLLGVALALPALGLCAALAAATALPAPTIVAGSAWTPVPVPTTVFYDASAPQPMATPTFMGGPRPTATALPSLKSTTAKKAAPASNAAMAKRRRFRHARRALRLTPEPALPQVHVTPASQTPRPGNGPLNQ